MPSPNESGNGTSCGSKHLKLTLSTFGVIVVVLGAFFGFSWRSSSARDARIRDVEIKAATTETQYEAIQKTLDEMKVDLKELRKN